MNELFKIPDTWAWASFQEVAYIAANLVSPADYPDLPHIAPNHIESGIGKLGAYTTVRNDRVKSPKHYFHPGQILYSKIRPYLAKVVLVNFTGLCSADMYPVDSFIDTRYLWWWLLSPMFTEAAIGYQGRSVLPKINAETLNRLPVPVAPLGEQRRIVTAIESHVSRLMAASAAVESASQRSENLISSIFQAAVTGELSASLKTDSNVTELIQQSRAATARSRGPSDLSRSRELSMGAKKAIAPYDLPKTWRWVPWRELGESRNGTAFPSSSYQENGIKLIRPGNLDQSGYVTWSHENTRWLPQAFAAAKPTLVVKDRALILNLTAQSLKDEFLGRACLTKANELALLNQRLAWLIPAKLDLDYAWIVFRSPLFRRFVAQLNTGSLIQHMYTWQVDQFHVPVPPIEEQRRIVSRVAELLDGIGRTMMVAACNRRKAHQLRQRLLSQAFAGELVSQERGDEPASTLLGRIRIERSSLPPMRRVRKMTKMDPRQETLL